jgi:hypothetical protein
MNQFKIAYGIYNQRDRINDLDMYFKFKGATMFYLERMQKNLSIICEDEIHEVLDKAVAQEFDYCVVQSAGCVIKNFNFDNEIRKFIDENHFGVAGHPLWKPGCWLELHPQFFIVNLKAWVEVDKPKFGDWHHKEQMLPIIERSLENFHDDYTPLWVKPTGQFAMQEHAGQGWKLLESMFKNNWPVITLTESLRFSKFYNYPEHETLLFKDSINKLESYNGQNWNQTKAINDARCVKDQIWLFNSEDMTIHNTGTFDVVANTASGFKLFDLFKNNRLSKDVKIIVYDFNPKSIEWYKQFYTWKNENLLECIRSFPDKNYFTWIGQTDSVYNENQSFQVLLQEVYTYYNGEENFKLLWKQFKNSNVTFEITDLYRHPKEFANLFTGSGNKLVNLSNIFSTDATTLIYGHAEVQASQQRCLAYLYIADSEIEVALFDFWNRRKTGKIKNIL